MLPHIITINKYKLFINFYFKEGLKLIKTVIIDDEMLAIYKLKHVLSGFGNIEVAATFTSSFEARQQIRAIFPDLVFVDIHMPILSGLVLAEYIHKTIPAAKIVFVTGFEEYEKEGLELGAIDYILKPITKSRLEKIMQKNWAELRVAL